MRIILEGSIPKNIKSPGSHPGLGTLHVGTLPIKRLYHKSAAAKLSTGVGSTRC